MTETIMEFLKEINIAQLIAIAGMFWFFYSRLDNKIEKNKRVLELKLELGGRIDKLSDKVEDVDRRLWRIAGSLATQGHCLYSQRNPPEKMVE